MTTVTNRELCSAYSVSSAVNNVMTFSFGQSQHERIEIDVLRYERQPVGDYHDDNWLTVQVRVSVGGFRGTVDGSFLAAELVAFLSQLRSLHQSLFGTAEFTTLEEQLHMRLTGDGKGHIELVGNVADQPGIGNRLHFTLHFDQSPLGAAIHELERVVSQFPVREA
ncbi:MAG TPA: hypothetical protein VF773_01170 [Verrucomicrobiae bacterium]